MSGDVQPRKRKDKKKKRDDDESSHGVHITKMGNDDVHLHVQHDHGTGGHWCAKVIFFSLMTILLGLVALIILENRGLSDLDTPLSESRFSNYFDGWVEEHRADEHGHDDHHGVHASGEEHDDHDDHDDDHDEEPYEEEEDHEEDDEEDNEDDGDGEEATVEDENADNDEEDEDEEPTAETATAEDDDNDDDNDNNDDDEDVDNDEDDEAENTEEATQEQTVEDDAEDDDDANNDDDNDDDNEEVTQENATAEDDADDENNTQENDDDNNNDEDDDDEGKTAEDDNDDDEDNDEKTNDDDKDNNNDDDDDEDDDDANDEGDSNVVDNDAEELLILQEKARQQEAEAKNTDNDDDAEDDDNNDKSAFSWASSLAGKIGVGVALAFVARILLLRKNPNASDEPPAEVIMRRRLTIAAPEDVFPEDEQAPPFMDDDEYVEEEVIIEEEIEYVDDDVRIEHDDEHDDDESKAYVPETFEQLNAMYRPTNYPETQVESTPSPQPQPEPQPQPKYKPVAPISQRFKERLEEPPKAATTIGSESVNRATAPVFTAPPPPPLHEAKIQHTPTSLDASKPSNDVKPSYVMPVETKPETSKSMSVPEVAKDELQGTTREVTHDLDYQPDDEDIDYDVDEQYDDEEEEESSLDGDDEEDDEISDVDDTELMSRLEAKYGKIQSKEYESDEDPEDPTWTQIKPKESTGGGGPQAHDEDFDSFERELREANEELMRENYIASYKAFTLLCERYPDQPSVFLGKAQSLDQLAEKQQSNKLLHEAIETYKRYLAFDEMIVDHKPFRIAADRCIERIRFMGNHMQTTPIHEQIIKRFPQEADPRNQLAVTHLLLNHLTDAKRTLQETLRHWPNDGFAQVHYGFVLKQLDQDYENAVVYLRRGIDSNAKGTQDGRFYFNLGDALQRLGRQSDAMEIYERGAKMQLFPSAYQRSLYNEPNLRAQPFWTKEETTYAKFLHKLEQNWQAVRDEGLSVLSKKGYFEDESENLRDHGEWQQFELFARGQRQQKNCQKAPITCGIIQEFKAASSCRRGQVKFSVLHPNTHVWPHCGPTNCRLRAHLGLIVPKGTHLRVADQYRSWMEGEFLIFDDSFEHEVWHNGTSLRLVLIVDIWHPELTERQRQTLSSI